MSVRISDWTVGTFEEWVTGTKPSDLHIFGEEPTSLSGFIAAWVISGDGIRACKGDFQIFLIAVLLIIEHWQKYPDNALLDYVGDEENPDDPSLERRVTNIFRGNDGSKDDILDPQFFAGWRFYHLYPHVGQQ